ncbi:MAG: hypothetical protein ABI041_03805 [Bdellovibrionia bacterium]
METLRSQTRGTEGVGEHEWTGREALRALVRRRAEKRMQQLARGMKRRTRAFGRGALVGNAIHENPGRAVVFSFIIGAAIGAIVNSIRQSTDEFNEILDEGEILEEGTELPSSKAA